MNTMQLKHVFTSWFFIISRMITSTKGNSWPQNKKASYMYMILHFTVFIHYEEY